MTLYYNQFGEALYNRAGLLLNSDDANTLSNCIVAMPPLPTAAAFDMATAPTVANLAVAITSNDGLFNQLFTINNSVGTERAFLDLSANVAYPFTLKWNGINSITFGCFLPGLGFTVSFNGTPSITVASTVLPRLNTGCFVVPDHTANLSPSGRQQQPYRYPSLTDNAGTIAAGAIVIHAHVFNTYRGTPGGLGVDDSRYVTAGTPFSILRRGLITHDYVGMVSGGASPTIFVETAPAIAGRLTNTATATTLPVPAGKLSIFAPNNVVGSQLEKLRINY